MWVITSATATTRTDVCSPSSSANIHQASTTKKVTTPTGDSGSTAKADASASAAATIHHGGQWPAGPVARTATTGPTTISARSTIWLVEKSPRRRVIATRPVAAGH